MVLAGVPLKSVHLGSVLGSNHGEAVTDLLKSLGTLTNSVFTFRNIHEFWCERTSFCLKHTTTGQNMVLRRRCGPVGSPHVSAERLTGGRIKSTCLISVDCREPTGVDPSESQRCIQDVQGAVRIRATSLMASCCGPFTIKDKKLHIKFNKLLVLFHFIG